jgi:two-component system CheB/CheR fusion protein
VTTSDPQFEVLLEHLKRNRGFDFTGYKRSSLMRRVLRRMAAVGIDSFLEYVDFLEVHPQEFNNLFNTILINVTSFFRDVEAWTFLASEVIPQLLAKNNGELRIWSAGCASGEEAYTIAMLFCEALGPDKFHERVKIYATDLDDDALLRGRVASYPEQSLKEVPEHLKEKYFIKNNGNWTFRPEFRRCVIFGRHDLVQDAPISRLDLLTCRNTLMYLNAETQSRILNRFHFAIKDRGFLFLGKAEMLLSNSALFTPIELKYRIFAKAGHVNLRERLLVMAHASDNDIIAHLNRHIRLRELAFESALVAQVIIDNDGVVHLINGLAKRTFGLSERDLGKPLQDLQISYRPIELRSLIDQAEKERRTLKFNKAPYSAGPAQNYVFDIQVSPLLSNGDKMFGTSIAFHDVTSYETINENLKAAHEELETTSEELQSTNEELETTNEELQSTNEELETTNEELQSTNEELETTNEELQSTNEELETANYELKSLTKKVESSNSFLQSILASMRYAVVALDKEFKVLIWNKRCTDLWGLRSEECVGKNFFDLDLGLPVENLKEPVGKFSDLDERYTVLTVDAHDRKGKSMKVEVRIAALKSTGKRNGILLLMDSLRSD